MVEGEFISENLKKVCKKKKITIKYVVPYIYEKDEHAEQG